MNTNLERFTLVHFSPGPAKLCEYVCKNPGFDDIIKGSFKYNGLSCRLCPFMCSDTRKAMCIFRIAKKEVECMFRVGSEGLIDVAPCAYILIVRW